MLEPFALHHQPHVHLGLLQSTFARLPADLTVFVGVDAFTDSRRPRNQCGKCSGRLGLRGGAADFGRQGYGLVGPLGKLREGRGHVLRMGLDVGRDALGLKGDFEVLACPGDGLLDPIARPRSLRLNTGSRAFRTCPA